MGEIKHLNGDMIISMKSAEVDPEDISEIALTQDDRISGKLHIEGVVKITENNLPISKLLEKKYKNTEIMHLNIFDHKIVIEIIYNDISNTKWTEYSTIEIEAEKIWWENIPDLLDPFW
jgi:hypothetical protein